MASGRNSVRRTGQIHLWSRGEELITDDSRNIAAAPVICPMARCSMAKCSRFATSPAAILRAAAAHRASETGGAMVQEGAGRVHDLRLLELNGHDMRWNRWSSDGAASNALLRRPAATSADHCRARATDLGRVRNSAKDSRGPGTSKA